MWGGPINIPHSRPQHAQPCSPMPGPPQHHTHTWPCRLAAPSRQPRACDASCDALLAHDAQACAPSRTSGPCSLHLQGSWHAPTAHQQSVGARVANPCRVHGPLGLPAQSDGLQASVAARVGYERRPAPRRLPSPSLLALPRTHSWWGRRRPWLHPALTAGSPPPPPAPPAHLVGKR